MEAFSVQASARGEGAKEREVLAASASTRAALSTCSS